MTRSNLYSVLCTVVRLGAVYVFVTTVTGFIVDLFSAASRHDGVLFWISSGQAALAFVLALLLWMYPGALARIAASRRSLEHFESDIAPHALQYIAFSTLGLWFAIKGIIGLAYTLHRWLFLGVYLKLGLSDPRSDPKVYGLLAQEVAELLLGVALAFGSRGLVVLLARLRHGGLVPAQTEAAPARAQEEP